MTIKIIMETPKKYNSILQQLIHYWMGLQRHKREI